MIFKSDKQTVDDLALFGNRRGKSVYNIFNKTATAGGAGVLEQMFLYPLSNRLDIERRLSSITFFIEHRVEFPFGGALLDAIEFYLSNKDER
ncbi:MAG: DNA mismatch repair protein, partial [Bacteroidia bacterium]|nr:DNA mismatch repair protein [Bacteroidia bacterium]